MSKVSEWLQHVGGYEVYTNATTTSQDVNNPQLTTPHPTNNSQPAISSLYSSYQQCNMTATTATLYNTLLSHPTLTPNTPSSPTLHILDKDTLQLTIHLDLDVRVTINTETGEISSDPFLGGCRSVGGVFRVLEQECRVIPTS